MQLRPLNLETNGDRDCQHIEVARMWEKPITIHRLNFSPTGWMAALMVSDVLRLCCPAQSEASEIICSTKIPWETAINLFCLVPLLLGSCSCVSSGKPLPIDFVQKNLCPLAQPSALRGLHTFPTEGSPCKASGSCNVRACTYIQL